MRENDPVLPVVLHKSVSCTRCLPSVQNNKILTMRRHNLSSSLLPTGFFFLIFVHVTAGFLLQPRAVVLPLQSPPHTLLRVSTSSTQEEELIVFQDKTPTDQWEMDCYSRPVLLNGKKLWELLITDSNQSFRYRKQLPSNQVNSKNVRLIIEELIETSTDRVKPTTIRFFRGAMFNMLNIALKELDVVVGKPSRCTFALAQWLEERHRQVYPNMEGYQRNMAVNSNSASPSFLDVRTPVKLPDALRGEKYAFVSLPLSEFIHGGVNADNIGMGRLCPVPDNVDYPADAFVQGVVIFTPRATGLASWLAGTELVALKADLRKRVLVMETDIDTQYLMAKLNDVQREEAAALEEGKDALGGLHFVSVQEDDESDPAGFWLLRELPTNI